MSNDDANGTTFTFAVWYQDIRSKPDQWYVMDGRDWNQRYKHQTDDTGVWETADQREADDTASALVNGLAFPHRPDRGDQFDPTHHTYRKVVAARVITIVRASQVTATYGTPVTEKKAMSMISPDQIVVHVPRPGREDMGLQAVRAWIRRADAEGLKTSVWAQEAIANRVGPKGGKVAELVADGGWHVVVETTGRTSAHRDVGNHRDRDCPTCVALRADGLIPPYDN
jgi:hypothetical protein